MGVSVTIGTPVECVECGEQTRSYFGVRGEMFPGPTCKWCHPSTMLPPQCDDSEGDDARD